MALLFPRVFDDMFDDMFDSMMSPFQMVTSQQPRTPSSSEPNADRRVGVRQPTSMTWMPRCDMIERDNSIAISAEIPGMKPEDVHVDYDSVSRVLTVKGETKKEEKDEEKDDKGNVKRRRCERRFGMFERRFAVPDEYDVDKIQAKIKNGVLDLSIPRKPVEPAKESVRRINITQE